MGQQLQDGTGRGYLQQVDQRNRAYVDALTRTYPFLKALDGQHFSWQTQQLSVSSSGGTKKLVMFVNYTEAEKKLALLRLTIGWNGGSTNRNRSCLVSYQVGLTAPDTNISAIIGVNTNVSSPNLVSSTSYKWDGVGTGMTGHTESPAGDFSVNMAMPGWTDNVLDGTYIFGPNTTFGVFVTPEEDGLFSFSASAILIDNDIDGVG